MRRRVPVVRIALVGLFAVVAVTLAGCSGIPGSGPVQDVGRVSNQVNEQALVTPDPGMSPVNVVRGFVNAAARISLNGTAGSAYDAPKQFLTAKAQQSWQKEPESVTVLSDQLRIDPGNQQEVKISGTALGTLDKDRSFHTGNGALYRATVHLVQDKGQWRISDPPADLLIVNTDFQRVFSARTLYFLDASRTVVVPDRRYLINGTTDENRVEALLTMLLKGPAGVLRGAAVSELTGGSLRTHVQTQPDGVTTKIDLQKIDVSTPADKAALAAQIVWTLNSAQVAISINGKPLDPRTATYTLSTAQSFNPDRLPGKGAVAADPYVIDPDGAIVDLKTGQPLWGQVGTGSAQVLSAAMSAATGTLAAVSAVSAVSAKSGQTLLIGQPLNQQSTQPALEAATLTQPSFSRTGDEVWVVQNGASKNPEIYQISTGLTSSGATGTGTASRAKVGSTQLVGKGPVTALALSPDGVRVAIVAGGKLYMGAIGAPAASLPPGTALPGTAETPEPLNVVNLQTIRGELDQVGPITFRSANQLLVVSKDPSLSYRSITDLRIDGYEASPVTSIDLTADVQAVAVSVIDPDTGGTGGTGNTGSTGGTGTGGTPDTQASASTPTIYISAGPTRQVGTILKLQGSLNDGQWVAVDQELSFGTNPFFPN